MMPAAASGFISGFIVAGASMKPPRRGEFPSLDRVIRPEEEMLKFRNFGKTSLQEIKDKLAEKNLELGMDLTFLEN